MSTVAFDPCEPLSEGITLIEASAGTGKTYTIAALAARHVAEGMPLEDILIITFTRLATGDVRDRVRERFVQTEAALARHLAGLPLGSADAVTCHLAEGSAEQVQARRRHLERAISGYDAATISTTHGFCQDMLAELGTLSDLDPETELREDLGDLLSETVDDLYLRKFARNANDLISRREAGQIVRVAAGNPGADLEPADAPPGTRSGMRRNLAARTLEEWTRRKQQRAEMTFDDLLTRLNTVLDGAQGKAARERLRRRFKLVLVDEFQDTDPVQWQILHRAFEAPGVRLVLIGDPKQAIYGFRGADVRTYLTAAGHAGQARPLELNFRSDQRLIDGLDALFGNAQLGDRGIRYRRVRATDEHQGSRLGGGPPLRFRLIDPGTPGVVRTRKGTVQKDWAWDWVTRDVARAVSELMEGGTTVDGRAVRAGDIAVLVRTARRAEPIRQALAQAGVPAAVVGAESVFVSPAATDWLRLLSALERPDAAGPVRAAALTAFIGWEAQELAGARQEEIDRLHARLHGWARILREAGVAALERTMLNETGLAERVLGREGGERRMTDLRHLGQLLHRAASAEALGATALHGWLAERMREGTDPDGAEVERERRLESDADAVQLLTVHRSKGLEFPIVLLPSLWDPPRLNRAGEPVAFHGDDGRRKLDVGLEGERYERHLSRGDQESAGEELRLAYVALTRASHAVVAWWVRAWAAHRAPLTRLLMERAEDGRIGEGNTEPEDEEIFVRLEGLGRETSDGILVQRPGPDAPAVLTPIAGDGQSLAAARFDRGIDLRWRRSSYSSITSASHEARVGSEPERALVGDEPVSAVLIGEAAVAPADLFAARLSPMDGLPMGPAFGTLVHRVLQEADFAAGDLRAELRAVIDRLGGNVRAVVGRNGSPTV